jgi:hypothetical protein
MLVYSDLGEATSPISATRRCGLTESFDFRHRRTTGEVLADVHGRSAVDELLSGQQRDAVRRAERDDSVRIERG